MKRLNQTHKAVLVALLDGPSTRVGLAISTRIPWREVSAALRGLTKNECARHLADARYALTPKGEMLAKALRRHP